MNSPVAALNENGFVVEDKSIVPVKSRRVYEVTLQNVGLIILTEGKNTEYGAA